MDSRQDGKRFPGCLKENARPSLSKALVFYFLNLAGSYLRRNIMKPRTRGEAEAEITQAVIQFEKEYLGRGPLEARTFFVNDMILIRLRGLLTAGDRKLAETREGQALLKETRRQLCETSFAIFKEMIVQIIGCQLVSFHTDISTKTGERIIVLTTDTNLDTLYR
jgi:uncharacterized protein YbcI